MGRKIVRIQQEINPNFRDVWKSDKPYNVLKGGRNSFKSSVIALKLVYMLIPYMQEGECANVVVIRKVANTIRDSVFQKMQWALGKFGLLNRFKKTVAPFKLIDQKTGSCVYFYGQDDFQKLKSNDIGNLIAVWYEEAAEFNSFEEFDQTNITFMRQKHELAPFVQIFWSYNPPRNPYSWINEWVERAKKDESYLVHHSTYKDDTLGFVTAQMMQDIIRVRDNDYDYYRYIYEGIPVGIGDNVYNMDLFHGVSELPKDEHILALYFATDTGHSVSATTTLAFAYTMKRNVYLLSTDYYSPVGKLKKRSPVEHCEAMERFYTEVFEKYPYPVQKKTVDSADGAIRNQYFNLYGERLHPVSKGRKVDMIDNVIDLLAQGRFFYLENEENQVFLEEHRDYRWIPESIENSPDNPAVVKERDHTCDAFQYFCKDNLRDLGLKY